MWEVATWLLVLRPRNPTVGRNEVVTWNQCRGLVLESRPGLGLGKKNGVATWPWCLDLGRPARSSSARPVHGDQAPSAQLAPTTCAAVHSLCAAVHSLCAAVHSLCAAVHSLCAAVHSLCAAVHSLCALCARNAHSLCTWPSFGFMTLFWFTVHEHCALTLFIKKMVIGF